MSCPCRSAVRTANGHLCGHPGKLGRRAALDIASRPQFADAPGLGFWCGERNGLTVVDIDSPADAELQHAIDTYGDYARHRADRQWQGHMSTTGMTANAGASGRTGRIQ